MAHQDIIVVGGGIAGVSAASALRAHSSKPNVTLIEAETGLALHTTGRSAAILIENYGTDVIKQLTKASVDYFTNPPSGTTDHPLVSRRGFLTIAGPEELEAFEERLAAGVALSPSVSEISANEAKDLFGALRPELITRAMYEPEAADIDVSAVHQSFARRLVADGGMIVTDERAARLELKGDGRWEIESTNSSRTGTTTWKADLVVNAAGAWGDDLARRAGIEPIGLEPKRRTAFMVSRPAAVSEGAPLVGNVDHTWYVKPEGPQLLCSPADETPSEPCDAKAEEIDIARAIDEINTATTLAVRSVRSSWAGLRTFTSDRSMVIGPEPAQPSFIWCVGQGGTGIQTSPAAGQLVADLALDGRPGPKFDALESRYGTDQLLPDRFR